MNRQLAPEYSPDAFVMHSASHANLDSNKILQLKHQTNINNRRRSRKLQPTHLKVRTQNAQVSSRQHSPKPTLQRRVEYRRTTVAVALAPSKLVVEHLWRCRSVKVEQARHTVAARRFTPASAELLAPKASLV